MNNFKLLNVAITYKCNKQCDYCYVKGIEDEYSDMNITDFHGLLDWFVKIGQRHFNFIGGEPTIHPKFKKFLKISLKRNFNVQVISNGLFDKSLFDNLPTKTKPTFLISYNPVEHYSSKQYKSLKSNLSWLHNKEYSFSIKFLITDKTKNDLIFKEAAMKFKPKTALVDVAVPNSMGCNVCMDKTEFKNKKEMILKLKNDLKELGVNVGSSRPYPYCIYKGIDSYSACSSGLSAVIVNPDLSIFPCVSLFFRGPKITTLQGSSDVRKYYSKMITKLKWEKDVYLECKKCIWKIRLKCQGVCLGHKSEHFNKFVYSRMVVLSQYGEAKIKNLILKMDKAINKLNQLFETDLKPKVYICKSKEEMENYSGFHTSSSWATGFVSRGIFFTCKLYEEEERLKHEFCHVFIEKISNCKIPRWFHEGLSEYVASGNMTHKRFLTLIDKKLHHSFKFFNEKQVNESIELKKHKPTNNVIYQQLGSFVGFIIEKKGFNTIIKLLKAKENFNNNFEEAIGENIFQSQKSWFKFIKKRKI